MDRFQCEEAREQQRAQCLTWHAQMASLFVQDRLAFERERKRLLNEFFSNIENEDMRRQLHALQTAFEEKMKHAGSARNRFVLAQTFFWDHFHKTWRPGIEEMNVLLKNLAARTAHPP